MTSYGAGHTETQLVLPDPLAGTGYWSMGAWALPATMLSFCSATVFATVFFFLQASGDGQSLFVLSSAWTAIVATTGAVLAWVIVAICRRRPGRLWPRIWALGLACANSLIAVLGLFFHERSWSAALAVAGLSAAAALTPRLARLRPDSAMVQRIAPLSLLILLIIVPSSCAVRRTIARDTEEGLDRGSLQLPVGRMEVEAVASFDSTPEASGLRVGLRRAKG